MPRVEALYGPYWAMWMSGTPHHEALRQQRANAGRLKELESGSKGRQERFSGLFNSTATESLAIKVFGITEA